jgi:trehalose 6-phosphate phosphatase
MESDGAAAHDRGAPDLGSLIERTARSAASTGFFFDFDGVLAPIVENPYEATPIPDTLARLAQLATLVKRVAIVSARPVGVLAERLAGRLDGVSVRLFGLYGLEFRDADGRVVTEPAAEQWIPVIESLTAHARAELPPEVLVEPKRISVALHYRTAPHLERTVDQWARAQAADLGLKVVPGRMVVEIKPPVERDKGHVVRQETSDLQVAWYFGDDLADLAAFRALDARRVADPDFLAVRVAVTNDEPVGAVVAEADVVVSSPHSLPELLDMFISGIRRHNADGIADES